MELIRQSFIDVKPVIDRRTTEDVIQYLDKYEDCKENYAADFPYSLLHYAFMFRRLDEVEAVFKTLTFAEIKRALHFEGECGYEWITPLVCAKWNLNYIYAYDEKNNTKIIDILEDYLPEVEHIDEIIEYTDVIDDKDKRRRTVFDIFWRNRQPLLDIVYFNRQELSSKQVDKNKICIVMDEVGTGKTVSALYAVKNAINKRHKKNEKARILIVCPYNKREDWQNDIRRQLGRYAHIVEQSDNGLMYKGALKKVFFKETEDVIMIAGQRQGSDLEGSHTALKESMLQYSEDEKWDLVVIDEGHISFLNYKRISAESAVILTATPIVVNAKEKRTYKDYVELLKKITGSEMAVEDINPIQKCLPDENDIYVNWFREDMGKKAAERKIRFVSCKRHPDRNKVYDWIKDKKGALTALIYDQDDEHLFWYAREQNAPDGKEILNNDKLEKLVEVLHENDKSFIIFCEHTYVVDLIFERIKDEFSDVKVAEKYGKTEKQYRLGNVQNGQLINTLMQELRDKQRVLFVTTGKTGGTGLNLGEFDGIIHYELPFTSIELEQRFGRVDRIDTNIPSKNRDMIFMLNECGANENDREVNRMLYYCTTKIDITCQYMPIRNTVLYYPEFIKRNGRAIRESLIYFQKEQVLSEANEMKIKEIEKKIGQYERDIRKSEYWNQMGETGNCEGRVKKMLNTEKQACISDEQYRYMEEYITFLSEVKSEIDEFQRVYKKFLDVKKTIYNWLAIIGLTEVDENSEIFYKCKTKEDSDEESTEETEEDVNKRLTEVETEEDVNKSLIEESKDSHSVQSQIEELIKLIDESDFEHIELNGFSSEGIFCYIGKTIRRSKVDDYRNGNGWR